MLVLGSTIQPSIQPVKSSVKVSVLFSSCLLQMLLELCTKFTNLDLDCDPNDNIHCHKVCLSFEIFVMVSLFFRFNQMMITKLVVVEERCFINHQVAIGLVKAY